MEASKCFKTAKRICNYYEFCKDCPLKDELCLLNLDYSTPGKDIDEFVRVVERWDKEHSSTTRQDKFLKQFPNAEKTLGQKYLNICPRKLGLVDDSYCAFYSPQGCCVCKQEYWLEDVEE